MSLQTDLIAGMKADSTLSGLVSARIYNQVYTGKNEPTSPYITWQTIADVPERHVVGASTGFDCTIQFVAWASTWVVAKQTADAIRGYLDGLSGTVGSTTGVASRLIDEDDMPNRNIDPRSTARRWYGIRQDFSIWHQE